MDSADASAPDQEPLAIQVSAGNLRVSYVSSLLRVVQAALREVARGEEHTRAQFDRRPQPVLVLSRLIIDGDLRLQFTFADPTDSTPLEELSAKAFGAFLDRFSEYVRSLPQPSLWGGAAFRPPRRPFESELSRRMDQVYREIRRSPRATIRFGGRVIEIEGDRMETT